MDRRRFLKTGCVLCGASLVGTGLLLNACKKNNNSSSPNSQPAQGPTVNFTLDLSQPANAALNNSGGSVASNGVVVVNSGGSYIAVAQSCTHEGCNISYNSGSNNFMCPCHSGVFDTNGKVVSGPPPAPVKKYTVTKNGNVLTIAG